jgi:hypothetical protein
MRTNVMVFIVVQVEGLEDLTVNILKVAKLVFFRFRFHI